MKQSDGPEVQKALIDPARAVNILDFFFQERELKSAQEDWVLINATLMQEIGEAKWLNELLDVFTLETWEYKGHEIINPYLAVRISPSLRNDDDSEPPVARKQWVKSNADIIKQIGANAWLWRLLEVLETGELA